MSQDQRLLKGVETKQRIDAAAMRILAEEGFTGLSAQKIARAANISKSAVFHHYPRTEDIIAQVYENIATAITEPINTEDLNRLEDLFEALGNSLFTLSKEDQVPYLALFHFYQLALTQDIYAKKIATLKHQVGRQLSTAILSIEPSLAARLDPFIDALVITLDAYGMHSLIDSNPDKLIMHWRTHTTLICNYLRGV